jgi:hypothetical protein
MSWRRRLLASLPLAAATLWLTTAAASAQALGLPSGAPQAPTSAPKVAEIVNKQAAQPAVHAAQSAQQTVTKAAQPAKQTVDQATKQTNAAVTAVSHSVEKTVQSAVATAPAPVPSPPSLPAAPEIPALSPVVETVADVVAQVVAPIAAVVGETEQSEADMALAPVAPPEQPAQVKLPVAAQPAIAAPSIAILVTELTTDTTTPPVMDPPGDEELSLPVEASSDVETMGTPVRFAEINASAAFPQPALVSEAPVVDASLADAEDVLQSIDVDSFEPIVPRDTTHFVSPTPTPTAPLTSKLPASIGLPNTAGAGQLPSLTALTAPDRFRAVWPRAGRLPSVIVLPNLAPPG